MAYILELRQRFTMIQNRYDLVRLNGSGETPLAYAEQKRFSLKERVTFFTDTAKQQVAFTMGARNIIELVGTYDIAGPDGAVLATLRKDAMASLARSTYRLETPQGEYVGRERTWWRPIARRVVGLVSDVPWLLPLQFDITDGGAQVVMSVDRQFRVRDVYVIDVRDDALDWRIAGACGVAIDAFMNR